MVPVTLTCVIQVPVISTHEGAQSASVVLLHVDGQQPSLVVPLQVVIGVFTHLAVQVPAFCSVAGLQGSVVVQLVGQAPG
jgi:hypothetical protein